MVYYGDEAGMWGPSDPSDREPMIWKDLEPYDDPHVTFKQDVFDQYQRLIAIHRKLPVLQLGFAHTVMADNGSDVFAFSRDLGNDHVLIAVNRSPDEHNVELKFGPDGQNIGLINWLDPTETKLTGGDDQSVDGRPEIAPIEGSRFAAVARHGTASVTLPPWGDVILSSRDVNLN